jgi:3-oxocholest-4-en-26-oyl-CoA dehydrogenase alpha subunit
MDFGVVELDGEAERVGPALATLLDAVLGDVEAWPVGVKERAPESLRTAMGQRGLLTPHWPVSDGGGAMGPIASRVIAEELMRRQINFGRVNGMVAEVVRKYGSEEIRSRVLRGVARGEIVLCLGYSEPDGGSDIAAVSTRAMRDGDGWRINGTKVFTSYAEYGHYVFLLTKTDREAPRHKGLTMFLVPLHLPGIEIQPLETFSGLRTNITYYSDVWVGDEFRLGDVNEGWSVLHDPLNTEHGANVADGAHLAEVNGQGVAATTPWAVLLGRFLRWADRPDARTGLAPGEDPLLAATLAEVAIDFEIARNTPGAMGKFASAEGFIRSASRLAEMVGIGGVISPGDEDCVEEGVFDWAHRCAQVPAITGGTLEVFKNMLAVSLLGLPRQLPEKLRLRDGDERGVRSGAKPR